MADLDLGTLRGHVDLDIKAFDRKYGDVDKLLNDLERRKISDVTIDADTTGADKRIGDIQDTLRRVDGESGEVVVTGDASRAESEIGTAESALRRIDGETAEMTLDADASPAEAEIAGLGEEGEQAGEDAGRGLSKGVIAALVSIPVAGAVIGIGVAIGGSILEGIEDALSIEATRDMFSAQTGLDAATANRFGLAAGESYANAFGESTKANLDTARHALQQGLIDEDATQAQITAVVNQLSGISDVFEYDIPTAARAVGQMLKTDLVDDAEEGFDLITAASQGVLSDDLLDTLNEYSGQFEQVGLDGADAMGLIRQAMEAGARDTDKVADAVKEAYLAIEEGADPVREALSGIGVDAADVVAGIKAGGPEARDALAEVFTKLRETEEAGGDTGAAVREIFKSPGEDLGTALFAMDLETAQQALGDTEGAAQSLLDTIGDNAATQIESARRNIEVAADGIKGALAAAFSDDIAGAAEWVSANRAPIMEFFLDAANMAFDLAQSFVESAATGTEAFGDFVGSTGPAVMDMIAAILEGLDSIPFLFDLGDERDEFDKLREGAEETFAAVDSGSEEAADWMRTHIGGGIDDVQTKMNEEFDPKIMAAKVHDATVVMEGRLAEFSAFVENEAGGEVTINGNTLNAEDALYYLINNIDEQTGMVNVGGQTVPAEEALGLLMGQIESSGGNVTIAATRVPADEALSALMTAVANSEDSITIGGNKIPADEALAILRATVRGSSDEVTIGGNDYPAETVLSQLIGAIAAGHENVTIGGEDYPADSVLSNLLATVNASGANIGVGANTSVAEANIRAFLNTWDQRTITTYNRLVNTGAGAAPPAGHPAGLASGGPVVGAGSGTSDDVPIMGSNGEHMWTTAEVNAAGGHDAMYAMRQRVLTGDIPELAGGGPVTGSTSGASLQATLPRTAQIETGANVTKVVNNTFNTYNPVEERPSKTVERASSHLSIAGGL